MTADQAASGNASIVQLLGPLRQFHMPAKEASDQPLQNMRFDQLVDQGIVDDIAAIRRS